MREKIEGMQGVEKNTTLERIAKIGIHNTGCVQMIIDNTSKNMVYALGEPLSQEGSNRIPNLKGDIVNYPVGKFFTKDEEGNIFDISESMGVWKQNTQRAA